MNMESLESKFDSALYIGTRTLQKVREAEKKLKKHTKEKTKVNHHKLNSELNVLNNNIISFTPYAMKDLYHDLFSLFDALLHSIDYVSFCSDGIQFEDIITHMTKLWSMCLTFDSKNTRLATLNLFTSLTRFVKIATSTITTYHNIQNKDKNDNNRAHKFNMISINFLKDKISIFDIQTDNISDEELKTQQFEEFYQACKTNTILQKSLTYIKTIVQFLCENIFCSQVSYMGLFIQICNDAINKSSDHDVDEHNPYTLSRKFSDYDNSLNSLISFIVDFNNKVYDFYTREICAIIDNDEIIFDKLSEVNLHTSKPVIKLSKEEVDGLINHQYTEQVIDKFIQKFNFPKELLEKRETVIQKLSDGLNNMRSELNTEFVKSEIYDLFFIHVSTGIKMVYDTTHNLFNDIKVRFQEKYKSINNKGLIELNPSFTTFVDRIKNGRMYYTIMKKVLDFHDVQMSEVVIGNNIESVPTKITEKYSLNNIVYNYRIYAPHAIQLLMGSVLQPTILVYFKNRYDIKMQSEKYWQLIYENSPSLRSNYEFIFGRNVKSSHFSDMLTSSIRRHRNHQDNTRLKIRNLTNSINDTALFIKALIQYGIDVLIEDDTLLELLIVLYGNIEQNTSESQYLNTLLIESFGKKSDLYERMVSNNDEIDFAWESIVNNSLRHSNRLVTQDKNIRSISIEGKTENELQNQGFEHNIIGIDYERHTVLEKLAIILQARMLEINFDFNRISVDPKTYNISEYVLNYLLDIVIFNKNTNVGLDPSIENRNMLLSYLSSRKGDQTFNYHFSSFKDLVFDMEKGNYDRNDRSKPAGVIEEDNIKKVCQLVDQKCKDMIDNYDLCIDLILKLTVCFIKSLPISDFQDKLKHFGKGILNRDIFTQFFREYVKDTLNEIDVHDSKYTPLKTIEIEFIKEKLNWQKLGTTEKKFENFSLNTGRTNFSAKILIRSRWLLTDALQMAIKDAPTYNMMNSLTVAMDELLYRNSTYKIVMVDTLNNLANLTDDADVKEIESYIFDINTSVISRFLDSTSPTQYIAPNDSIISNWCNLHVFYTSLLLSLHPIARATKSNSIIVNNFKHCNFLVQPNYIK
jgi:hypothetical protein